MKTVIKKISSFGLLVILLSSLAMLNGCDKRGTPRIIEAIPTPNIESQQQQPIVAVYSYSGSRFREVKIIHLVWADGTVIFSQDNLWGGSPYFKAKVSKPNIASFFKSLAERDLSWEWYNIPDGEFQAIVITIDGKKHKMVSCHELFGSYGDTICTDHGVEPLGDRSIKEVRSQQSPEYQKFRADWDFLRKELMTLVPKEGERFEDKGFDWIYE